MTSWSCRRHRVALVDAAEGTLSRDAARALEAHLATCAACRADLDALRAVSADLLAPPAPVPSEDFWRRQRQAIMRRVRTTPSQISVWRPAWRLAGVVASVFLAVLVSRTMLVGPTIPRVAEHLDDDALLHLHDLLPGVTAASTADDADSDLLSIHDLGDDELDRLAELLGDSS